MVRARAVRLPDRPARIGKADGDGRVRIRPGGSKPIYAGGGGGAGGEAAGPVEVVTATTLLVGRAEAVLANGRATAGAKLRAFHRCLDELERLAAARPCAAAAGALEAWRGRLPEIATGLRDRTSALRIFEERRIREEAVHERSGTGRGAAGASARVATTNWSTRQHVRLRPNFRRMAYPVNS